MLLSVARFLTFPMISQLTFLDFSLMSCSDFRLSFSLSTYPSYFDDNSLCDAYLCKLMVSNIKLFVEKLILSL